MAYRAVALGCFDCYADAELERRPPGPGLPSSAGRRFPRLVPRRALFPPKTAASSGAAAAAPTINPEEFKNRRRLAAARRMLALADAAAAASAALATEASATTTASPTALTPPLPLSEVEAALAEGAYGAEPIPPMAVLLERAIELDRRTQQRRQRWRGGAAAAAAQGGRAGALPLPSPKRRAPITAAADGVGAVGVARGWKSGAWNVGEQAEVEEESG